MFDKLIETIRLLNASCRDMAALISRSMDQELSGRERFAVRLHLLYCKACRRYHRHLAELRQLLLAARQKLESDSALPAPGMPADARARIRQRLADVPPE